MCLSTVYTGERAAEDGKLIEYVTNVDVDGDNIRLYDITGDIKDVRGRIRAVDLIKNTIFLDLAE
ncbi:MAG: CooT family nickel-binding protein [Clostridiales Family XIII bacterium]|jgi:predicted RNA-binding protein|nr:CooT family nickel-binding protein [Clostridiales Family XIII bacterium]